MLVLRGFVSHVQHVEPVTLCDVRVLGLGSAWGGGPDRDQVRIFDRPRVTDRQGVLGHRGSVQWPPYVDDCPSSTSGHTVTDKIGVQRSPRSFITKDLHGSGSRLIDVDEACRSQQVDGGSVALQQRVGGNFSLGGVSTVTPVEVTEGVYFGGTGPERRRCELCPPRTKEWYNIATAASPPPQQQQNNRTGRREEKKLTPFSKCRLLHRT